LAKKQPGNPVMSISSIKRVLIGKPFPTRAEIHERLDNIRGLAIFASDPISSNAYATEAIMGILILMGSVGLVYTLPIAVAIALLVGLVIFSYIQTIMHYPMGGGAYTVSKDNLGTTPSLFAGSALLIDYILTVSVSVSAGVRALTSAFPELHDYRVVIAIVVIAFITLMNLRGIRESGTIFALPTYMFIFGVLVVIAIGIVRISGIFGAPPIVHEVEFVEPAGEVVGFALVWLFLRAFASGCTALTGIEAISNGVQAFKKPESVNAVKTMVAMGIFAMSLFLGISYIANHLQLVPTHENSILSQMTEAVEGYKGPLYYWVQFFTMMILFLAANTGFQDFPRLSSFLARDGFMPRWMSNRGDRLVFSSGIIVLAVLAAIITAIFQADEIAMLPLYALGVMMSFTLSQSSMVLLMGKVGRLQEGETYHTGETDIHYESGWRWKQAVNFIGALTTGIVLVVLMVTKFLDGAWLVVVASPLLVLMFRAIHNHYKKVATQLRTRDLTPDDISHMAPVAIVPIADVHRGTLRALKYAKLIAKDVRAVCIVPDTDPSVQERVRRRWERFPELTQEENLVFIEYEYRDTISPLCHYITMVSTKEFPNQLTTVIIPEFVPRQWWERLLHNQTANLLRNRLHHQKDVVVIDIPYHV
jgi:amino acid transporter